MGVSLLFVFIGVFAEPVWRRHYRENQTAILRHQGGWHAGMDVFQQSVWQPVRQAGSIGDIGICTRLLFF